MGKGFVRTGSGIYISQFGEDLRSSMLRQTTLKILNSLIIFLQLDIIGPDPTKCPKPSALPDQIIRALHEDSAHVDPRVLGMYFAISLKSA